MNICVKNDKYLYAVRPNTPLCVKGITGFMVHDGGMLSFFGGIRLFQPSWVFNRWMVVLDEGMCVFLLYPHPLLLAVRNM